MMKVEETPIFYKGQNDMCCLLYSILFGGNCNRRRVCACEENRRGCGCSRENESRSQDCCGQYTSNGAGFGCCEQSVRNASIGFGCCEQNVRNANIGFGCCEQSTRNANTGCGCCEQSARNANPCCGCCVSRCCSGFGRHGGECVCGDLCYYCRQYALCCCEKRCDH